MLYERIFREFEIQKLRYAVIGGIAVNLHGYNRVTGDLDIIISLDDANVHRFIKIVEGLGLVPRVPVKLTDFCVAEKRQDWIHSKGMKVFSVYNPKDPLEHIDVKIDSEQKLAEQLESSEVVVAGDVTVRVVNINTLIELKREAGRERDLVDIRALEEIKKLR